MLNLVPKYKVEMLERRNAHFYTVNGIETQFPGSTTALNVLNKPYLPPWAAKMAALKIEAYLHLHAVNRPLNREEISTLIAAAKKEHRLVKEHAADLGTRAHRAIDEITKGNHPQITEDIAVAVQGFLEWQDKSKLKIVHGDLKLIYLKESESGLIVGGFGGSLDGIAIGPDGKLVVVDYKTSNYMNDTYPLQIASYCYALAFTYGLDYVPEGYCVRFGKEKTEVEVAKVKSIPQSFSAFMFCLSLYETMRDEHFEESIYAVGAPKKRFFKKSAA